MADHGGIQDDPIHISLGEIHELGNVEVGKDVTQPGAPSQDCGPRESALERFEADLLEQMSIITNRHTPLHVVIGAHLQ